MNLCSPFPHTHLPSFLASTLIFPIASLQHQSILLKSANLFVCDRLPSHPIKYRATGHLPHRNLFNWISSQQYMIVFTFTSHIQKTFLSSTSSCSHFPISLLPFISKNLERIDYTWGLPISVLPFSCTLLHLCLRSQRMILKKSLSIMSQN